MRAAKSTLLGCPAVAGPEGETGALGGRGGLLVHRPGAYANDPPAAGADGLERAERAGGRRRG